VQFPVSEVKNIFPVHNTELGGAHADLFDYGNGFRKFRCELVGYRRYGQLGCHLSKLYTEAMIFRRERPRVLSFSERLDLLRETGFATESLPDGRVRITKHGVGAIIGDTNLQHPEIERAGVLIGSEIATLLNRGYQMFLETPSGKRVPALADQLKALHEFESDVKDALGLVDLYNTSLGTTSRKHIYDRVFQRDTGDQPKPWEGKNNRFVPPDTKGSYR
jgi:hypothetical protein